MHPESAQTNRAGTGGPAMPAKLSKLCRGATMVAWVVALTACVTAPSTPVDSPVVSASIADIVAGYRQQIPARMQQAKVPGLVIVVVDDKSILWAEGFGYTDWDRRTPVTPDTLFSIQSMSKSFAATAALFAAQDGLVDLDAPITTYLPDFHVNSIFEAHPEQKITLRMLLSHTAGFVHEAPVGGNHDLPGATFEAHIASISDTWLKFPVGTRYSYSNLGIDLAGYILQMRAGTSYARYVQDKVFGPLGMTSSLMDSNRVRSIANRAIGHLPGPLPPPTEWLLIPSGGVWTTAADMARYLQFHINDGAIDGKPLLPAGLAETMYTPPNIAALGSGYALGIETDRGQGTRRLQHGGGGFGFSSYMIWHPELKLGAAVLTNAENPNLSPQLTQDVLNSIIDSFHSVYADREATAVRIRPAYLQSRVLNTLSDDALQALIAGKALPNDEAAQQRRKAYVGTYVLTKWGAPQATVDVKEVGGQLSAESGGVAGPLIEVQPGLFLTPQGEPYDLRGPVPTADNECWVKVQPWMAAFFGTVCALCGPIFLLALLFWPARAVALRLRRSRGPAASVAEPPGGERGPSAGLAVAPAALGALVGLLCLVAVALVPNLGYIPWPRPYIDLPWWQYAGLSLPFAGLALAAGLALILGWALWGRAWGTGMRVYCAVVVLALVVFNVALIK
jgi:CubicO group peptidase (beta-lactamase class C family)